MNNFEYGVWQSYSGYDSHVVIPWGIRVIAPSCFKWCAQLTSVVLPETIEKISRHAFNGCMSLTHITLKNQGAIVFDKDWFYQCDNLRTIHAPGIPFVSFKSDAKPLALRGFIENPSVFSDARKAEYIKYMTGQKKRLLTTAIANNDIELFKSYEQFNIKIPSELCDELIGLAAMEQKTEVQAWLMDYKNRTVDRKTEAKEKARTDEQQLDNPYMAKFLKAEWSWSKLDDGTIRMDKYKGSETDIVVPPVVGKTVVTAIGKQAFYGLNIENIRLPASIISIGEDAFSKTPWMKKQKTFVVANGILLKYKGKDTDVLLPDEVNSIGDGAFAGCDKLTSIDITENITRIGSRAFYGCTSLSSIALPSQITGIETETFAFCKSLTDIILPDSVTYIRERAFVGCTSLCSVTLPDSVTAIGRHAFRGCNRLTALHASPAICSLAKESKAFTDNLKGVTVVVTGRLYTSRFYNKTGHNVHYKISEVKNLIVEYGGCVSKEVTPETTCLVTNGFSTLTYLEDAEKRNIATAKNMGVDIFDLDFFFMKYFPEGTPE